MDAVVAWVEVGCRADNWFVAEVAGKDPAGILLLHTLLGVEEEEVGIESVLAEVEVEVAHCSKQNRVRDLAVETVGS